VCHVCRYSVPRCRGHFAAKPVKDAEGAVRVGLEAKTKLNRKDYGINCHQVLESGAMAVGEEVELEINAEAVKSNPETK
jgi:polyisoprenoid-binding protein YceI